MLSCRQQVADKHFRLNRDAIFILQVLQNHGATLFSERHSPSSGVSQLTGKSVKKWVTIWWLFTIHPKIMEIPKETNTLVQSKVTPEYLPQHPRCKRALLIRCEVWQQDLVPPGQEPHPHISRDSLLLHDTPWSVIRIYSLFILRQSCSVPFSATHLRHLTICRLCWATISEPS